MTETNYEYFMRPEPRKHLGPIEVIDDNYLNKKMKVREAEIGMTRNASKDNRKKVQVYLKPYPHIRIEKAKPIQGWYKNKHEPKGVRARPCYSEALLMEPYGGWCSVGCAFCYINSGFRGYRGTGLLTVPIDYGQQIRKQLESIKRGAAGYFTSFTDPFLEIEDWYHNSEEAAKAFVDYGLPIFFLSRLKYPDWAIELLKQNKYSYAQKSINTCVQKDWQKMSPGASSLQTHMEDISKLKDEGIYVSIQCNPIIPGIINNEHVVKLFKELAQAGADHVIVKFVEAGYSWAPAMTQRLKDRFGPERGEAFEKLFTDNIGGQRSINEDYRIRSHKLFSTYAKKYGLTYSVCYEYRYERSKDGSVIDKTGISLAREFTTSDQCHGQRVPTYYKPEGAEKFEPLECCPPSGCLYCIDDHGAPKCGDELFGQAKALKLVDLKKDM